MTSSSLRAAVNHTLVIGILLVITVVAVTLGFILGTPIVGSSMVFVVVFIGGRAYSYMMESLEGEAATPQQRLKEYYIPGMIITAVFTFAVTGLVNPLFA